jgi:16S rRNA (cytosine1402-N4)-methyltransferase
MMTPGGTSMGEGARRGTSRHVPVLLPEVLRALRPQRGATYIDGTFGAGGYSVAILAAAPGARVLAIDRDPEAISAGAALAAGQQEHLILQQGCFGALDRIAEQKGLHPIDGVVLDIGISSMQVDDPARGFSFQRDGPLDMRMSAQGPTAADFVNLAEEAEIADVIFHLGGERSARAIARRILARRAERPLMRTSELAELVVRVLGREKIAGRHAATRTFQALRMHLNDELGELARGLAAAERSLNVGGRLVVVTFHSLEDRLTKQFLRARAVPAGQGSRHLPPGAVGQAAPSFRFVNPRPVSPRPEEVAANPRARSAKLRAAVRTDAPAWPEPAAPVRA